MLKQGGFSRHLRSAILYSQLCSLKVIILLFVSTIITLIVKNTPDYQESLLTRYDPVTSQLTDYDLCQLIKTLKPNYLVCHYPIQEDQFISNFVSKGTAWEGDLSRCFKIMMEKFPGASMVFVDVGANIGVHSLYLAASGYNVLAVEPVTKNLNLMYESARRQGTLGKIQMFHNAVSDSREPVSIHIDSTNVGGSYVQDAHEESITNNVQAVLLQDIFNEIQTYSANQLSILVVKMDIETFECKAVIGSPNLFNTSAIHVAVFFMEWHFLAGGKLHKNCPLPVMQQVGEMFHSHGYHPYKHIPGGTKFEKLDLHKIATWPHMDTAWFHDSMKFSKSTPTFSI